MSRMDPKKPEEPGQPSETDLEAVFQRWEQERDALPSGTIMDELPLTDDELALDHEVAKRPEALLEIARSAARSRLILASALTVVSLVTLYANREDFGYFMTTADEITDLGDIRARWEAGERPGDDAFPALTHNTWMRYENGIMIEEREGATGTFYFFDPILKAVVVTRRDLPEKNPRTASIHVSFAELISNRWILPRDVSAAFSGQGRLLRAKDAPRRYSNIVKAYREYLVLDTRMGDETLWLFLDGAEPKSQGTYAAIYGIALAVILLSIFFYWRARRRVTLLEESIGPDRAP
ncbi:MAG: hypothetical protein ACI9WU_003318 [Myxococcota bacterium]|jgi:hypothetical protein